MGFFFPFQSVPGHAEKVGGGTWQMGLLASELGEREQHRGRIGGCEPERVGGI